MITSGFTNAPVSRFLVFVTVIGALAASLTDTRYYIHIQVVPHFWRYGQFWRVFTWQVCGVVWFRQRNARCERWRLMIWNVRPALRIRQKYFLQCSACIV